MVPVSFLAACTSAKPRAISFAVGQKVPVGKLVYQVLEAQWLPEAPGSRQPPKNRILQLAISVTNSGSYEASIPFLHLIDAAGNEIIEIGEIEGNSRWFGAIRRLQPALTETGAIYFDVPVGAYKLEVVDTSNADDEKMAHIEIPASLAPPPVTPGSELKMGGK
jgi:hypothetical protein